MASCPITSGQIDGETVETVTDFTFLGSKITTDGDCNHEIKRHLFLGRKAMTNLDSILKSRDITLPTKVCLVKAMVFPIFMYGCWIMLDYKEREGNGTPLQHSCLENPMDSGAWWAAVHGVSKGRTWLSNFLSLFTFMHWRRKWQPTPVFLPGESQGWGSLVSCRLWDHRVGHDWRDLVVVVV